MAETRDPNAPIEQPKMTPEMTVPSSSDGPQTQAREHAHEGSAVAQKEEAKSPSS